MSQNLTLTAPDGSVVVDLDLTKTREAESRLPEARMVNPSTYADLEFCFNEAYRELRRHDASLGYQITQAEKRAEMLKAEILLDRYPEFMKDRPKSQDSADTRKAFLMRDSEYLKAVDTIAMLKAAQAMVDGKIKVFEKTCQYCRKQMDLIIRSGLSSRDLYNTNK